METIYDNKNCSLGLSGGINSAALLCYLKKIGARPKSLHLFYAHFIEHSPDTFHFVADCIRWAKNNFDNVHVKITKNTVLGFFEEEKFIPHPKISPCSNKLKIEPMMLYCSINNIDIDLVGYVKGEKKRYEKASKRQVQGDLFFRKDFPIKIFDDNWCFEIVDEMIGWHPAIYDIKENGERIFKHNNCLPCKNATIDELKMVEKYYPEYMLKANMLSDKLKSHWGRNRDEFYLVFGREHQDKCTSCIF